MRRFPGLEIWSWPVARRLLVGWLCAWLLWGSNLVLAAEWSYEGTTGPEYWGYLSHEFWQCRLGLRQSPINIETARVEPAPLLAIEPRYEAAPLRIVNNGHTVQVNYAPGSGFWIGQRWFELRQFHFHAPSEESIDGQHYPLVAHLVHSDADGQLAVVAVLFALDDTPVDGAIGGLAPIWDHLPAEPGPERVHADVLVQVDDLLPSDLSYYFFQGSLTTPPCTEGVWWFVLRTPVSLSQEELERFTAIYPHNARPLQPTFGRAVLVGP